MLGIPKVQRNVGVFWVVFPVFFSHLGFQRCNGICAPSHIFHDLRRLVLRLFTSHGVLGFSLGVSGCLYQAFLHLGFQRRKGMILGSVSSLFSFGIPKVQRNGNSIDLVESFPTHLWLQNVASIQPLLFVGCVLRYPPQGDSHRYLQFLKLIRTFLPSENESSKVRQEGGRQLVS